MADLLDQFEQALLAVDRVAARDVLMRSANGNPPYQFLDQLIVPALERIGQGWEQGRVALAQVYMSGRICEQLVDTIIPSDVPGVRSQPKMAIVVLEDQHLLGKRIVYSVLRSSGFSLLDYGSLRVDDVVRRAQKDQVEVLLVSTLMLPSALRVKELRTKLDSESANVKIVVGGAPFRFDESLWREVGANAMGRTAVDAVSIIAKMVGGGS